MRGVVGGHVGMGAGGLRWTGAELGMGMVMGGEQDKGKGDGS